MHRASLTGPTHSLLQEQNPACATVSDSNTSCDSPNSTQVSEEIDQCEVSEINYSDVSAVQALCNNDTKKIFNIDNPFQIIHTSFQSFKLTNTHNRIVGALTLDEFPNVPGMPRVGWSNWVSTVYNIKNVNSFNCLWVHLAVYDEAYKYHFISRILKMVFKCQQRMYLIFVVPRNCHELMSYLDGISSVILPQDHTNPMKVQTLRLLVRQDFMTQYKIRHAVEEDNDDLVPLINAFSTRFVELYGEFYIAEIISRHPEDQRRIIVAEHEGEAVSVLIVNPQVNYEQLNNAFDLHSHTGLYKAQTARQGTRVKEEEAPAPVKRTLRKERSNTMQKALATRISRAAVRSSVWDLYTFELAQRAGSDMTFDADRGEAAQTDGGSYGSQLDYAATYAVLNDLANEFSDTDHSTPSVVMSSTDQAASENMLALQDVEEESDLSESSEKSFYGTPNAFAIEVLAAQQAHRNSLYSLIVSSFECFPERDYVIMMLPHDMDIGNIVKYFVRVPPKATAQHPHELYVCHRGQLNSIVVKVAYERDREKVVAFLRQLKYPADLLANYDKGISGEEKLMTLLAMSGKNRTPIGLAQVAKLIDVQAVKQKYHLRTLSDVSWDSDFSFGYFVAFCLAPQFQRNLRFFAREVHRKSGYQTMFYGLNQHDSMVYRTRPLSPLMQVMWQVPPRNHMISTRTAKHVYPEEPYTLFMSTPKLLFKKTVHINHRIIVVGASTTALSFLSALLNSAITQQRQVQFNNVVLVSTDGLPWPSYNPIRDMLLAKRTLLDPMYLEQIGLRCRMNIVQGTLQSIDRKNKSICVDRKVVIPYEYLFLMTGLQYGVPRKKGVKDYTKVKLPANCFTINTDVDGEYALTQMKSLIEAQGDKVYQILIYGLSIDCYCCIAALIEFGVPSNQIVLVEPPLVDRTEGAPVISHDFIFQVGEIYETVMDTIERLGVEMICGYKLFDWNHRPVMTLKFESLTRYLCLSPLCAFIYSEKVVDVNVFRAIHESGLVYDGRLVINPECRTNDECIFAAGPLTKYSRKLWADHLAHRYYNSAEIGTQLGRKIRAMLIPFKEKTLPTYNEFGKSCWRQYRHVVPNFFKPLMTYCLLPGGMWYMNMCKPGLPVPLETAMSDNDYGTVMSTGHCGNLRLQGYFRVHLDVCRTIETITCLSLQKFNYRNIALLWGKHEALLNNLVRRFERVLITDLFAYFQKPWCSAIFMDDFPELENAIMKVMTSLTSDPGDSPLEDLFRIYMENGFKPLNKTQRNEMDSKFTDSAYQLQIEQLVMDFIRDNLGILDMYAHPVNISYILSGYEESPMFKQL